MSKNREYNLHLILGSPSICAWTWKTWQHIAQELNEVLRLLDGQPATYSRQLDRSTKPNRDVAFGRMTWGDQVHERWAHASPKTIGRSNTWEFADTQVWLPSRLVCEREKRRPDFYFQLLNGALGGTSEPPRFGSVIALGVARDLSEPIRLSAEAVSNNLGEILDGVLLAYKTRSWAIPFGPFAVVDSLDSLDTWLFRTGPRHAKEPSLALLKEPWGTEAKVGTRALVPSFPVPRYSGAERRGRSVIRSHSHGG